MFSLHAYVQTPSSVYKSNEGEKTSPAIHRASLTSPVHLFEPSAHSQSFLRQTNTLLTLSKMSSSVPAPSATATAIPQVSGIPEECYGKSSLKVADYSWNGTLAAEDSVCAANYNDITMYCCQQAGGSSAWGVKNATGAVSNAVNRVAKNANGTAGPDCGLQLCKLSMDKEADFMYCQTQHGAEGSCKGAKAANSSEGNSTASQGQKKEGSSAPRVGPASIAVAVTFLASAVLAL